MDRSLFPGLPAFCLPHSRANSTILIHLLHFLHPLLHSFDIPFHLYCFTPSFCVTQLTQPLTTSTSIISVSPLFDLLLPLSFSSSISPSRNGLSAKPRPNPLIFLHVVTARAAIPLFLHPLLLSWADGQCSDLRLTATCCNFSS